MRLRHIKEADPAIQKSPFCINEPTSCKGHWAEIFGNQNPIYLEIGMGKGRFLMDMAEAYPDRNFVGLERYSSVLYRAVQKIEAKEEPPKNLFFLCEDARKLNEIFERGEVERIYLNFSDPWPKDRHKRRRLTSPDFLTIYKELLKAGDQIEFKTDNRDLFDYSVETIREFPGFRLDAVTYDLHHDEKMNAGNIMTEYEERFSKEGNPICKLIAVREFK